MRHGGHCSVECNKRNRSVGLHGIVHLPVIKALKKIYKFKKNQHIKSRLLSKKVKIV